MSIIKFEPKTMDELQKLSLIACKSGLMPTGTTPERFMIIAMKGAELGIPILQAIHGINVINNKPAISAELMMALIYNRVPSAKITYLETSDSVCTIEAQRTQSDNPSQFTFSLVEAEKAGLLNKSTWKQYPSAMLRARCISAMARAIFPDALMGASYTAEELGAEVTINDEGQEVIEKEIIPEPIKTDNEKYVELSDEIKNLFNQIDPDNNEARRIAMCIRCQWNTQKIVDSINAIIAKSKPVETEKTDYEKWFMLAEDIKALFIEIDPNSKEEKNIAYCKVCNWNEKILRFELKKSKENLDKALARSAQI